MKSEDIAYLYSLTNEYRSIRYDLRNMEALASALGNPQRSFESVLIAGTNGKGSVARMLSAMSPDAGLYTSPHLVRLNERIRIGDREISDDDLHTAFETVKETIPQASGLLYPPTYFEIVTAMAFTYFRNRVRFAILEVGLGGRLDATNVVAQRVSVITSIGLDHQQYLGTTLDEIAAEKAGIIKANEPVVVGPDVDYSIVREKAGTRLLHTAGIRRVVRAMSDGRFDIDVVTPVREYNSLRLALRGRHQIDNAITAIRAAECLNWTEEQIRRGIETTVWPGRLEMLGENPRFLLDGAHNPHAARALAAYLQEFFPSGVWMIFGAMADKQYEEMIRILAPSVQRFIMTRPQNARAVEPHDLAELVESSVVTADVRSAIAHAREHAPKGTPVLVCGSLYLIGEARAMLQ